MCMKLKMCSGEKIIGGKCGRDTPGNMPNPEVKPASVDGTMRGTHGRADRCQFRFHKRKFTCWASSFLYAFTGIYVRGALLYQYA